MSPSQASGPQHRVRFRSLDKTLQNRGEFAA